MPPKAKEKSLQHMWTKIVGPLPKGTMVVMKDKRFYGSFIKGTVVDYIHYEAYRDKWDSRNFAYVLRTYGGHYIIKKAITYKGVFVRDFV